MTSTPARAPRRRPMRRRLWRALLAAAVPLSAPVAVAAQAPPTDPQAPPADALDQTIEADQPLATGAATLSSGHVDVGPRFVEDSWTLLAHDDTVVPSVWRHLDETVFRVGDAALQTVPDDPTYGFLGVDPGTDVYVVPQVEQTGVVWVGWNTQDPRVMETIDRGATLTLLGVQGPGELTVYLQAGNLTEPDVLWQSTVAERQPIWMEVNTHTHANWVFTEPGVYLVQVEVSADLVGGEHVSDVRTLRFAVGDGTSDGEALAAEFTSTTAPAEPAAGAGAADAAASRDGDGSGNGALIAAGAGGAVVLLAGVGIVAVRGSSAKRRAEQERAASRTAGEAEGAR